MSTDFNTNHKYSTISCRGGNAVWLRFATEFKYRTVYSKGMLSFMFNHYGSCYRGHSEFNLSALWGKKAYLLVWIYELLENCDQMNWTKLSLVCWVTIAPLISWGLMSSLPHNAVLSQSSDWMRHFSLCLAMNWSPDNVIC